MNSAQQSWLCIGQREQYCLEIDCTISISDRVEIEQRSNPFRLRSRQQSPREVPVIMVKKIAEPVSFQFLAKQEAKRSAGKTKAEMLVIILFENEG